MVQGLVKKNTHNVLSKKTKKATKNHEHKKKKSAGGSSSFSQLDKTVTKYINNRANKKLLERAVKMGEKFTFVNK
ncbi:hypothetical protein Gasu2_05840 [Galdieria sulphuraria]|uniref:Uncharacterized protein n=1 Tax=Galdieria sulphuraria TaxID=130081 RepID=M2W926_GALSU|nr:uncharacterized protein Gasu_04430 [Galdieria sulphuraria]EME32351.1 hypothetical protein Gasu_04430 [Galdieria sulphuraria]GJD06152.1 hypothetical protein Gasu2_05840 [Galdieria sulphuraria]|eukprot:XP_005708871.1 hypothetical protein Gasu_04430 [Galdieria sulphuraria]